MEYVYRVWGIIGRILFWILWPFWIVYFRFSNRRSRVVVIHENKVLLVQGWIGQKQYSLPGGGAHKHESYEAAGIRELHEETGISIPQSALIQIGAQSYDRRYIRYSTTYFSAELANAPRLTLRKPEISSAVWLPLEAIGAYAVNDEAKYALKRYKPLEQASLL